MQVVIDTNIFDNAFLGENGIELQEICNKVLLYLKCTNDIQIAVDNTYEADGSTRRLILSEYRNKLTGKKDFEIYLMGMYSQNKIFYVDIQKVSLMK